MPTSEEREGSLHCAEWSRGSGMGYRLKCALGLGVFGFVLGVAALLTPALYEPGMEDTTWAWACRGAGTHGQLAGVPLAGRLAKPCSLPAEYGLPCPTCGMTTTFALWMDGRPIAALVCQPFGFVLALGTSVGALYCLVGVSSGYSLKLNLSWLRWKVVAVAVLGGGLVAWLYKIVVWRIGP